MPRKSVVPVEDREWLTTPEVAEYCQVATDTVRSWIRKGILKSTKVNGYNRVSKTDLGEFAMNKYSLDGDW